MLNWIKLIVVTMMLFVASGSIVWAIQLTGEASTVVSTGALDDVGQSDSDKASPSLGVGATGGSESVSSGVDIWIPGLGVVGKMPQLNFGLEMLYGHIGGEDGAQIDMEKSDSNDPDFTIKGTIKRKF
jgi:hypothetical protein